jgi:adenylate cyclase, class 2
MPTHTMREVEIKLRVADVASLISKLRRLDARSIGRVLERNDIYDTEDGGFRRRGRLLRLRAETPAASRFSPAGKRRTILTAKAPFDELSAQPRRPSRYKERLEREVVLDTGRLPSHRPWPRGVSRLSTSLEGMGLRPSFTYEKYRTMFQLASLHLALDETPVGTFLELEGPAGAIDKAARALGFTPRHYIQATYWDLYAADCRRRSRKPMNMVFRRVRRISSQAT